MRFDKVELSGLIVLFIGVFLLAFTFFSAFTFLIGKLGILASQNLLQVFGEALAPLIEAVIRILYLGIMGWIGSILTIRAVQLLKKEKTETPQPQQQPIKTETRQVPKQEPKPEAKPEAKEEPKEEAKTEAKKPKEVKEAEEDQKAETPKPPEKIDKPEEAASASSPPAPETPTTPEIPAA